MMSRCCSLGKDLGFMLHIREFCPYVRQIKIIKYDLKSSLLTGIDLNISGCKPAVENLRYINILD
jgi:hypothetical protein